LKEEKGSEKKKHEAEGKRRKRAGGRKTKGWGCDQKGSNEEPRRQEGVIEPGRT